jgi:alpha-D-ribose 1-methylphosphonate 5-triphosphate synthase subunit PhnL
VAALTALLFAVSCGGSPPSASSSPGTHFPLTVQFVALAQQAPVLLIHEPTTSLDVGRQQEVLEILAEPVIAEHYGAHVRVIELNGSGKAVVPVRR